MNIKERALKDIESRKPANCSKLCYWSLWYMQEWYTEWIEYWSKEEWYVAEDMVRLYKKALELVNKRTY